MPGSSDEPAMSPLAAALATLLAGAFTVAVLVSTARQHRASSFATTEGVVTASEIQARPRGGTPREEQRLEFEPRISFSYRVGGRDYVSSAFRYDRRVTRHRGRAAQVVARYPVGSRVTVHYDPRDPADAILEPGTTAAHRWLVGLSAPMLVGVVGAWGAALRRSPGRPRALVRGFTIAQWSWGGAVWTSVAGVFALGWGWLGSDLVAAWGLVLLSSLAAAAVVGACARSLVPATRVADDPIADRRA
jgi:hypothetical protein